MRRAGRTIGRIGIVAALPLLAVVAELARAGDAPSGPDQSGFVEVDGDRIYYEVTGQGDPVVLTHGYGGNHSDLRRLLDQLGIERAHLVGQSMGGWTVVGFALEHPERVRSLTLSATVGGIFTAEARRAFQAYMELARSRGQPPGPPPVEDPEQRFLYHAIGSVAEPPPQAIGERLAESAFDLERARGLRVPVLMLLGERDPIFPPGEVRGVADLLPDARVVEIPLAGHSGYFYQPEAWNRALRAFLAKGGARS